MSMPTRSRRNSSFGKRATPDGVGPGSYGASNNAASAPSYAAFTSSKDRDLNANTGTSSITPGPGAYSKLSKNKKEDASSNAFTTKVARFAPFAPGSTLWKPSTIYYNPGPGTYLTEVPEKPDIAQQMRPTRVVEVPVKRSAPAIPRPEQSYGYEESSGKLVLQKAPVRKCTGVGGDTVGPAHYNPTDNAVRVGNRVSDFGRSTTTRKVFNPHSGAGPAQETPGPGHFTPLEDSVVASRAAAASGGGGRPRHRAAQPPPPPPQPQRQRSNNNEGEQQQQQGLGGAPPPLGGSTGLRGRATPTAARSLFSSQRGGRQRRNGTVPQGAPLPPPPSSSGPGRARSQQVVLAPRSAARRQERNKMSSAFASRVPMHHQMASHSATVGQPGPGAYLGHSGGTVSAILADRGAPEVLGIQRFGSTVARQGATDGDVHRPHSKPTRMFTPGPGAYGERRTAFDYKPRRTLTTDSVGFGVTDTRACMTQLKKDPKPGPGAYRTGQPPLAIKSMASAVGRQRGVFGASSRRFKTEPDRPHVGDRATPGPGAYNPPLDITATSGIARGLDFRRGSSGGGEGAAGGSSAFKSEVERFTDEVDAPPPVGLYTMDREIRERKRQGKPSDNKNVAFSAVTARFRYKWGADSNTLPSSREMDTPGPGQYGDDIVPRATPSSQRRRRRHRSRSRSRSRSPVRDAATAVPPRTAPFASGGGGAVRSVIDNRSRSAMAATAPGGGGRYGGSSRAGAVSAPPTAADMTGLLPHQAPPSPPTQSHGAAAAADVAPQLMFEPSVVAEEGGSSTAAAAVAVEEEAPETSSRPTTTTPSIAAGSAPEVATAAAAAAAAAGPKPPSPAPPRQTASAGPGSGSVAAAGSQQGGGREAVVVPPRVATAEPTVGGARHTSPQRRRMQQQQKQARRARMARPGSGRIRSRSSLGSQQQQRQQQQQRSRGGRRHSGRAASRTASIVGTRDGSNSRGGPPLAAGGEPSATTGRPMSREMQQQQQHAKARARARAWGKGRRHATIGRASRFTTASGNHPTHSTPAVLGPGAYEARRSFVTKSHNITMV